MEVGRRGIRSSAIAIYTPTMSLVMLSAATPPTNHSEIVLIPTHTRSLPLVVQELWGNRGNIRNDIVSSVATSASVRSTEVGVRRASNKYSVLLLPLTGARGSERAISLMPISAASESVAALTEKVRMLSLRESVADSRHIRRSTGRASNTLRHPLSAASVVKVSHKIRFSVAIPWVVG